jgi:hypothetical protein
MANPKPPEREEPGKNWKHHELRSRVLAAIEAIPSYLYAPLHPGWLVFHLAILSVWMLAHFEAQDDAKEKSPGFRGYLRL